MLKENGTVYNSVRLKYIKFQNFSKKKLQETFY